MSKITGSSYATLAVCAALAACAGTTFAAPIPPKPVPAQITPDAGSIVAFTSADRVVRLATGYEAFGNVRMQMNSMAVTCDHALVNTSKHWAVFFGHAQTTSDHHVHGPYSSVFARLSTVQPPVPAGTAKK